MDEILDKGVQKFHTFPGDFDGRGLSYVGIDQLLSIHPDKAIPSMYVIYVHIHGWLIFIVNVGQYIINSWMLWDTPLKINGWNPKTEVDGSNVFPFQTGDFQVPRVSQQSWCPPKKGSLRMFPYLSSKKIVTLTFSREWIGKKSQWQSVHFRLIWVNEISWKAWVENLKWGKSGISRMYPPGPSRHQSNSTTKKRLYLVC